jgi:hypothetical protein
VHAGQSIAIRIIFTVILLISVTVSFAQVENPPDEEPGTDTLNVPQQDELDDVVAYSARDSIRMDIPNQKIYLFGTARVTYGEIDVQADMVEFSFQSRVVTATYSLDSAGNPVGKPVFTDGKETFTADRIDYNFDSKKGLIRNVRTQVSEGYIDAAVVKKDSSKTLYIRDGSFCPCEDPDAETRFRIKRLKVMEELIVTGPGYLEIGGIPTPLAFPFGFFPNKKKQAAGIIIPTYGESPVLGFFLQKGGYYWPVNDYFDTQITGDIYSRGSWGLHNLSRYKVRYKYSGDLDLSYTVLRNGDPEFPGFSKKSTFFIRWNHMQDAKARPGSTFRANVNLGSVDNFQNTFSSNVNDYLTNTFNSSISWSRSFIGTPFSLAVNARHSQNSQNDQVSVTLPELSFNVNRVYPFAKVGRTGGRKTWYQQMGLTWRSDFSNQVTAGDTLYNFSRLDELAGLMRNGIRNTATLNTAIKLLGGRFTFTPSASYINRIYFQRISRTINTSTNTAITDTANGFFQNNELSLTAALTSKIYGYYTFTGSRFPVKVIRHVLTPQVSFRYRPELLRFESYADTAGKQITYSPYEIGLYGTPAAGNSGMITVNLINTVDMKVKSRSDTATVPKKVSLIENFNIAGSYDMFRDSLRFSNVVMSGRTTLFKVLGINYTGAFDPYLYQDGKQVNTLLAKESGKPARMVQGNVAMGLRLKSRKKSKVVTTVDDAETAGQVDATSAAAIRQNPDAFVDFSVPWSLNLSYSLNRSRSYIFANDLWIDSARVNQAITVSGDISITQKWKIAFNTGYDLRIKDFTLTSISVYRDLNCWEMSFDWIPFGFRRSYSVTINLKSALLKDLRLQRRRSWYDNGF